MRKGIHAITIINYVDIEDQKEESRSLMTKLHTEREEINTQSQKEGKILVAEIEIESKRNEPPRNV